MLRLLKKLLNTFKFTSSLNVGFDSGGINKPVIVLLHGIAATSKTWDHLIKDLDTEKYRVISLDLLGFGNSPKPKKCNYDVDEHIRYIRKTLRRNRVWNIDKLVGHSMGSIISARYARYYPNEVGELYLLSLPLYLKKHHSQTIISKKRTDIYLETFKFIANKKSFTIIASKNLRKIFKPNDGGEVREENWQAFRLSLKNTVINQNTHDDIRHISIPINIIYGIFDEVVIPESLNILSIFENVTITRLKNVNHLVGEKFSKYVADMIRNS